MTMPGWTGVETYRRLKQANPKLRIIVSSGFNESDVLSEYSRPHTSRIFAQAVWRFRLGDLR